MEATADESVAATTPTSTSHGVRERRRMMAVSSRNASSGTTMARVRITTRYTTVETPIAPNVPTLIDLDGVFRSPDMATPWVNPVIAGKKMANPTHIDTPSPSEGRQKLSARSDGCRSSTTPTI